MKLSVVDLLSILTGVESSLVRCFSKYPEDLLNLGWSVWRSLLLHVLGPTAHTIWQGALNLVLKF